MAIIDSLPNIDHIDHQSTGIDWKTTCQIFQRFTTPASIGPILRACVPELSNVSLEASDFRILDSRLKTYLKTASKIKSTLSVCYRLNVREGSMSSSSERIFYLKVFVGGRSRKAFQLLSHTATPESHDCNGMTHVPEQDLILWRFPHDPELPYLHQLCDLRAVGQYLPMAGLNRIGLTGPSHVVARQVVNYRPEVRCTHRYELHDSNQDRSFQLFAKTYRGQEGQILNERLEYFWERSQSDACAMAIAQPLGYSAPVNTLWQVGVPGTSLLKALDRSSYRHYSIAIAEGLASLHTSNATGLAAHSPADHLVEIRKKLRKLTDAIPHLSEACTNIANDIERTAPDSAMIPFSPIHWDFHVDQLMAHNGTLIFCDLDELVTGDPLQDLANFVVDLHFRPIDQGLVNQIAQELCEHYRRLVDWPVPVERFAWHRRLQFVNKAYRHYLRFAPGFEHAVERILRLAERGCNP